MKYRIRNLIGTTIAISVMVVTPLALAETNTTSGSDSSDKDTSSSSSSEDSTARQARLEKLKTDLKIKLDAKEQEKLKTRCKPAQTIVKNVGERFNTKAPGRAKIYDELVTRLNSLVTKLKAKGVDTTELEQEISMLQTKVTLFNTDLAAYKQALSDLRDVDCVTDPTAFKAALEAARTAHDKVIKDAADVKAYVKDTIKPTLQKIRSVLEEQEKAPEDSSKKEGTN